jgi:hypothetical protein
MVFNAEITSYFYAKRLEDFHNSCFIEGNNANNLAEMIPSF